MRHNPLRRLREVCFSLLISAQVLAAQSPKPTHGRADQPANLRLPEVHCATNFSVTCELTARSSRHLPQRNGGLFTSASSAASPPAISCTTEIRDEAPSGPSHAERHRW